MNDYLTFKKMITPIVLQILFWLAVLGIVIYALSTMFGSSFWMGLLTLILGPIVVRIYFELMIILFKIHDQLNVIRKNTENKPM